MSKERHPNLNAVGFTTDIVKAYVTHLRGAAKQELPAALNAVEDLVIEFVGRVDDALDAQFDPDKPN